MPRGLFDSSGCRWQPPHSAGMGRRRSMRSGRMPEQPAHRPPAEAVWQGRLSAGLDPRAQRLNDSLPVDGRLVPEELALSRAYATTLAECGVMTEAERDALVVACDELERDLGTGQGMLVGEDVHSAVETALGERCG